MTSTTSPIITRGDFASIWITEKGKVKNSASHPFLERWLHNLLFVPFKGERLSLFDELMERNCVSAGLIISIGGEKRPKRHPLIPKDKVKCLWSPKDKDMNFLYGAGGRDAKNILLWSLTQKDTTHPYSLEGLKELGVDTRTFKFSINLQR